MSVAIDPETLGAGAEVTISAAFGADLTAPSSTWNFTDITDPVMHAGGVNISPMGRSDEFSQAQPAGMALSILNDDGDYTAYNPTATNYPYVRKNTPIKAEVTLDGGSNTYTRFYGYVDGWVPSNDVTGDGLQTVSIKASGASKRLVKNKATAVSPMRRSILRAKPVVYAPLELPDIDYPEVLNADGNTVGSTHFGGGLTATADSSITGSKDLYKINTSTYMGLTPGLAGPGGKFNNHWQVDWFMNHPSAPSSETIVMRTYCDSPKIAIVDVVYGGGNWGLRTYDSAGVATGSAIFSPPALMLTGPVHWRVFAQQNAVTGTSVDVTMVAFPALEASGGSFAPVTVTSATAGNPTSAAILPASRGGGLDAVAFGHWSIYNRANFSATDSSGGAYNGELATDRMARIADEEGLELDVFGASDIVMGPQPIDSAMNILRDCEQADGGVLMDGLTAGLTYVGHAFRYNQDPQLTLSSPGGDVGGDLPTEDDDQRTVNRATITMDAGGSSTYEQTTGPLGSDTVGVYEVSDQLNITEIDQAFQIAAWRVHEGQADGYRYPALYIDVLAAAAVTGDTSVATEWLPCMPGSRIDVEEPRTVASSRPPGDTRLALEGWNEKINPLTWEINANCSQYPTWEVGLAGGPGWADCGASCTVTTMTTSATTVDVVVADACAWDHADGDFDVTVGGEDLTIGAVGALTASTPTFRAAGTAVHANAASVTPGKPAGLADGDAMWLLASCRDTSGADQDIHLSGVSVVGWEQLFEGRNFCLFGKVTNDAAGETMPTVNISPDVADAVQAVVWAFSGKWGDLGIQLVNFEQLLNGTAQNINYPALQVPLSSCLLFYIGWKADDFTSVAAISGATEIVDTSTTDGNDSGIVVDYVYSSAATSVAAGSFTVTGGATQISRGAVIAFRTAFQTVSSITRARNNTVAVAHERGQEVHTSFPLIASRS